MISSRGTFGLIGLVSMTGGFSVHAEETDDKFKQLAVFQQSVMEVTTPLLADNTQHRFVGCNINRQETANYKSAAEIDYQNYGWEKRLAADWQGLSSSKSQGKITLIDIAQKNGKPVYRYLANDKTHNQLYEPWSSSKIQAFTGAAIRLRQSGLSAKASIDGVPMGDLISSVNSYEPFGLGNGDSNAIASFFVNFAGRKPLTELFFDDWLKLSNNKISLRGAYGGKVLKFDQYRWEDHRGKTATLKPLEVDPYRLSYRCDNCGLTGNKPMTTLSQAEWLKRLMMIEREPSTRPPGLQAEDVQVLLYGDGHSDKNHLWGGMTVGISRLLHNALAQAIEPENKDMDGAIVKGILDKAAGPQWRVWQKIGWGPSETRGKSEVVLLGHVCLPDFQEGREFTVAAQTQVDTNDEKLVAAAGMKMQRLLANSIAELFKEKG